MPTVVDYVDKAQKDGDWYDIHDTTLRNTKGQANGLATLDSTGKIPSSQLPDIPTGQVQSDYSQTDSTKVDYIKNKPTLGTAAAKDIPSTGDASSTQVVMGNDSRLSVATTSTNGLLSSIDKSKLDGIATGAEVNQNAFSRITVGTTNIDADTKTDALTLVAGSNVTLTPDDANDKVTIDATDTTYDVATTSANGLMSSADKTKLNGIATGAEVNQNAFAKIKIGSSTVEADAKQDTLELVAGSNVAIDTTNDKVTIAATDTTYESKEAASGGTDVSLVTTGEKYTWNNKSDFSGAYADLSGKPTLGTAAAKNATDSYSSTGTDVTTGKAVAAALGTLDVTGASSIAASKTISAWSETDGKVSISTQDISIASNQVSGLGTAAAKNFTTSVTSGSADLVTSGAVHTAIDTAIENLPEPMIFKGTLGDNTSGATITSLPTAAASNEGYTYKVITAGTYASQEAKIGDLFICGKPEGATSYSWIHVPSGDEPSGTVTNVAIANGGGLSVSGSPITSSGTITISHADTSSQASVNNSGRTYIQDITLDTYGHVTGISSATETVTNTDRYVNSASFAYDSTNNNVKMTLTRAGSDTATVTGNIPAVSSSSAGVAPKGAAVSTQSQTTKFLREDGSWAAPSYTTNTDRYVNSASFAHDSTNNNVKMTLTRAGSDTVTVTGNIPKVSSSSAGVAPKGAAVSSQSQSTKFLREDGSWAAPSYTTDTNNRKSFYGTCSTAAATAAKEVTLADATGWELKAGTIVGVKSTNTNSASNVTLNVNGSGAKSIYYEAAVYTGNTNWITGVANKVIYYMYDGTNWVWLNFNWHADGNNAVTQTATTTSANYEVLFSATADNTTRTEGARKATNLCHNPASGALYANYFSSAPGITSRITSLNFTSNPGPGTGRTMMRLDLVSSSTTTGQPPYVSGKSPGGYLHTYYWDSTSMNGVSQFYIPNGDHLTSTNGPNTPMFRGNDNGTWTDWFKMGMFNSTITSGQVVVTDGAFGVIKSSGYTIATSVPSGAVFTDAKVTQTATTTNANYEVLFSVTGDNTTRTEGARKNNNLLFNPSTGNLQATQLNGVTIGSSPKFTDENNAVTQTADDSTNSNFEILFSATADNTTRTEGTRKSSKLLYTPSYARTTTGGPLLVNASTAVGSYDEGIRINLGKNSYATLCIGGAVNSVSGTAEGQFWIGTGSATAHKRKLYVAQNGSTSSTTYFYSDSASQVSPHLNVGGTITVGDNVTLSYNSNNKCLDFIFK